MALICVFVASELRRTARMYMSANGKVMICLIDREQLIFPLSELLLDFEVPSSKGNVLRKCILQPLHVLTIWLAPQVAPAHILASSWKVLLKGRRTLRCLYGDTTKSTDPENQVGKGRRHDLKKERETRYPGRITRLWKVTYNTDKRDILLCIFAINKHSKPHVAKCWQEIEKGLQAGD